MRKLVCICLIIAMIICGTVALANTQGTFDSNLLSTTYDEVTAKEWISSESRRCLFSIIVIMDLSSSDIIDITSINFLDDTYVGKNDAVINMAFQYKKDNDKYWIVSAFCPINNKESYVMFNEEDGTMSSDMMESILEETCSDGFYKNDKEEMYSLCVQLFGKDN